MRAPSFVVSLAATAATALLAVGAGPAHAFDDAQFCVAAKEFIRATVGDVGTWTDRLTRNDGVEIGCERKVVHFKRHYSAPASALREGWRERQAELWESTYCKRSIWREAIDNGWVVAATLTTVTGERLWVGCAKGRRGFYRVLE
ncbi:MAG TPA: hypothetical protein VG758_09545 [Hyphomicrobiaceae bacterium]|jgi:hypothetical protein|nr:hypothetical protein [Hyphomicrobiaceae bacterium]